MKEIKWINVSNDFYDDKLHVLRDALESGELVHIYVSCIGHTRAAWVEAKYISELKKIYGDNLVEVHEGWERAFRLLDPKGEGYGK